MQLVEKTWRYRFNELEAPERDLLERKRAFENSLTSSCTRRKKESVSISYWKTLIYDNDFLIFDTRGYLSTAY